MSAALILNLLAVYGPSAIQLIDTLIAQAEANGTVSATEWATLSAALKLSAAGSHASGAVKKLPELTPQVLRAWRSWH